MDQIQMPEEKPRSERPSAPTIAVPVPLFNAMALCFYGEGPRHWELAQHVPGFKDLSPHPTGGLFPPGLRVTDIPPDWRRVREPTDGTSDVPTTEGQ
jgi:hypothetical protein